MKTLVTGSAGFIGAALCERLLSEKAQVFGIDNLNDYYSVQLKQDRLERIRKHPSARDFRFQPLDLCDQEALTKLFRDEKFDCVINLAAQAGVRYSLTHPHAYTRSNVDGFLNILEGCRHNRVKHLVFASSSSVYGSNRKLPFSVRDPVDHPVSLYAATKKANELMAHSYSHLYGIPSTGLRFFTVYGPWGRPDMSVFGFTEKILKGEPIELFNHGKHRRDFTFIDDIVDGVYRVSCKAPAPDANWQPEIPTPEKSSAPYRIYNIGNSSPVWLEEMVAALEDALGMKAQKKLLPMQAGDVLETFADVTDLEAEFGFKPRTSIQDGIRHFVSWYRGYYRV
jgi:UDP-glucuronate 4-epimerase